MRAIYLAVLPFVLACETPLASRQLVKSPRILDIIAEAPEARPGDTVEVRLVTGGLTMPTSYAWSLCVRPESTVTFVAQSTFGQAEPNDACFGDAGAFVIRLPGNDDRVLFAVPADLLDRIESLQAVYGRSIDVAQLRRIVAISGLPLTVAVEMRHGATVLRGLKRVVIRSEGTRNSNPPPPSFRFGTGADGGPGGTMMGATGPQSDECAPLDGSTLRARPSERIEIAPEPTEAAWIERYSLIDTYGRAVEQQETAFYSFYLTAGEFELDRTRVPTRNTIWQAPRRPGTVTQWIVVRDGRGGSSACRYTIEVAAADAGL